MYITIPNRKTFNQTIKKFDRANNTQTKFCNMFLRDFLLMAGFDKSKDTQLIYKKDFTKLKNFLGIDCPFDRLFENVDTHSTNITRDSQYYEDLMKINSWYRIITEYRQGVRFYNPLCVHAIDKNLWIIDPGNSRLSLYEYYQDAAQFMITFYNQEEYDYVQQHTNLISVKNTHIDIKNRMYYTGLSPDDGQVTFLKNNYPDLKIHTHFVLHNDTNETKKYHHFEFHIPTLTFTKKDNTVYCNDIPYAKKEDRWKLLI